MDYEISDDRGRIDAAAVHRWISQDSYWALGRSRQTMDAAIANSLCLGAYTPTGEQAAFARIITDRATFAYLCDVFVFPDHRGHGLGKRIVRAALEHAAIADVRSVLLATQDAHGLYRPFGFDDVPPDTWMRLSR